jgi:hypothetical protein
VEALQKIGVRAEFRKGWNPDCNNFDAYFFQRNTSKEAISILYQLVKKSKPVVYDIDDDIFHIPEHNPVYDLYLNAPQIPWHQVQGLRWASKVSVSCTFLKDFYEHINGDVTVLPNCIRKDDWVDVEPLLCQTDVVRLFWGGSPTHKDDLDLIRLAVVELKKLYADKIEFVIMGQPDMDFGCEVTHIPAGTYKFFQRVMVSCDIGLAPMTDSLFNRAKSDLRLKELGCAKLATVASPVGEYNIPFVDKAYSTKDWVLALRGLIENVDYRQSMANKLHEWSQKFLIDDHIYRWDRMFKELIDESPSRGSGQGFTVNSNQRPSLKVGGDRVRVGDGTNRR